MRVISIINLKGGVGKTFTAAQMAYLLMAKHRAKVLMVDNDKQGNLSKAYGAYQRDGVCQTAKLLMGLAPASALVQHTNWGSLDIIPANMSLFSAAVQVQTDETEDKAGRFNSIREAADKAGLAYDFVIIDNPPDIGINVINALAVTDDVIIPIKIDQCALEGMEIMMEQIEEIKAINPRINFAGALVTMYKNNDTNVAGVEWLKANRVKLFNTVIRYSDKAAESTLFQRPVELYSQRSAVAKSYREMVEEYLLCGEVRRSRNCRRGE